MTPYRPSSEEKDKLNFSQIKLNVHQHNSDILHTWNNECLWYHFLGCLWYSSLKVPSHEELSWTHPTGSKTLLCGVLHTWSIHCLKWLQLYLLSANTLHHCASPWSKACVVLCVFLCARLCAELCTLFPCLYTANAPYSDAFSHNRWLSHAMPQSQC